MLAIILTNTKTSKHEWTTEFITENIHLNIG